MNFPIYTASRVFVCSGGPVAEFELYRKNQFDIAQIDVAPESIGCCECRYLLGLRQKNSHKKLRSSRTLFSILVQKSVVDFHSVESVFMISKTNLTFAQLKTQTEFLSSQLAQNRTQNPNRPYALDCRFALFLRPTIKRLLRD
jgi:hypothetical protein